MPQILARAGIAVALLLAPTRFCCGDRCDAHYGHGLEHQRHHAERLRLKCRHRVNHRKSDELQRDSSIWLVTSGNGSGSEQLSVDNTDDATGPICNGSTLQISGHVATKTITVIITPSTTFCSTNPPGNTEQRRFGSTSYTSYTNCHTSHSGRACHASGADNAGKSPLPVYLPRRYSQFLTYFASFDAGAAIIAKVKASLEGTATTGSVTSTAVRVFKANSPSALSGAR